MSYKERMKLNGYADCIFNGEVDDYFKKLGFVESLTNPKNKYALL